MDLALQSVYKRTGNGTLSCGKGQSWNEKEYQGGKCGKDANQVETEPMAEGQLQERNQRVRERWQGRKRSMLDVWTHCSVMLNVYATDEDDSEIIEETLDTGEDLQACCFFFEESEHEQWQGVIRQT